MRMIKRIRPKKVWRTTRMYFKGFGKAIFPGIGRYKEGM